MTEFGKIKKNDKKIKRWSQWTLSDEVKLNFDHCKGTTFWSSETVA